MPFVSSRRLQNMQASIRYKDELCKKYLSMMVKLAETNGDLSQRVELLQAENKSLRDALDAIMKEAIA